MSKNYTAILDIGSSKVTALIGIQGVNESLIIKGKGECEYGGFIEGEFLQPEYLKECIGMAISNAEKQANIKINSIFVGVPGEFSFCNCVEVEKVFEKKKKVKDEDITSMYSKALNNEILKSKTLVSCETICCMVDDGRKVYDITNIKCDKIKATISQIFIENYFVELFNKILSEIGIETVEYISSPVAETKYLLSNFDKQRGAIIIDVGYLTTSVCGAICNGCVGLVSFSLGGGNITAEIYENTNLKFSEAETIKNEIILTLDCNKVPKYNFNIGEKKLSISSKDINEKVIKKIDMLAELINKSLKILYKQNLENAPVYLTGGGISYITSIKEYLGEKIGKEIKELKPHIPTFAKQHLSSEISVLYEGIRKQNNL